MWVLISTRHFVGVSYDAGVILKVVVHVVIQSKFVTPGDSFLDTSIIPKDCQARLGRSQELRRNFKSLSVLGLATTTMSTWVALLFTSTFSLINGGLAGIIWLYFISWLCTFALAASLAEMASMAPTSGGRYRKSTYHYYL